MEVRNIWELFPPVEVMITVLSVVIGMVPHPTTPAGNAMGKLFVKLAPFWPAVAWKNCRMCPLGSFSQFVPDVNEFMSGIWLVPVPTFL